MTEHDHSHGDADGSELSRPSFECEHSKPC